MRGISKIARFSCARLFACLYTQRCARLICGLCTWSLSATDQTIRRVLCLAIGVASLFTSSADLWSEADLCRRVLALTAEQVHAEVDLTYQVSVAVILIKGDRIYLAQRFTQPGYGTWALAGGKVDPGESLEVTLRREVREEAGVEIKNIRFVRREVTLFDDEGYAFINHTFVAEIVDGEPEHLEPNKIGPWRSFRLDELPDDLFPPNRRLLIEERFDPISFVRAPGQN